MLRTDADFRHSINWVFVALITIMLALAAWQIRNILMLALAAVMLTISASMPVRYLVNKGLKRGWAIFFSMTAFILVIVLMVLLVFPTLLDQFRVLFADIIPRGIQRLIDWWNSGELYQQFPYLEDTLKGVEIDTNLINQVIAQVATALGQFGGSVLPLIGDVAGALLGLLIIIFLCMYFIVEPDRYIEGVIRLTPVWYRQRMREILARLDDTLRAWIRVTGVSMLMTGLGTAVGLAMLGIQQWAALGVLAGVLSFIPNFGPIIALVPSVAVAIIQAPQYTFLVVVIIYGVSFVQNQILGPILARESMKLAPVLILIGQIVFGVFFGFLGIMLAVPLTAIVTLLVDEIYVKDILGDVRKLVETSPAPHPPENMAEGIVG